MSGARDEIEGLASQVVADLMAEVEQMALRAVAKAVGGVQLQRAMSAALVRYSGEAHAKVASSEDAYLLHTRLAGRHQKKMARENGRTGRPL